MLDRFTKQETLRAQISETHRQSAGLIAYLEPILHSIMGLSSNRAPSKTTDLFLDAAMLNRANNTSHLDVSRLHWLKMKIEGSVIVITGGASGIGACCTETYVADGAKVVVWDFNEVLGQSIAQKTGCSFVKVDVTKTESIEAGLATTLALHSNIDALVNCAGIYLPTRTLVGSHKTVYETFQRVYNINLTGSFNCSRLVALHMARKATPGGAIVFLSSMLAYQASPIQSAYGASKAALKGMTIAMARDLSVFNIRVNTISPGLIETPMTEDQSVRALVAKHALVPRTGRVADVAHVIAAAIENEYLTGGDIPVDGGMRL